MKIEDSNPDILYSLENGILKLTLNRPNKKNAITIPMYRKLSQILRKSIQNNATYVVILTGSGRFFSSGNDFSFFLTNQNSNDDNDIETSMNVFKDFIDTLITYPKLLIAVVNGPAIGIGVTMLPLFDMVYATDETYFQTPFTSLGVVAEGCSTYTFPKIFGKSKAGDMLYLSYRMNAFEAKQYGLVSEVYKYENLNEVWTYLKKLSTLSSWSILAIKRLVKKWDQNILLEVNTKESSELVKCLQSPDSIERLMNLMLRKSKI